MSKIKNILLTEADYKDKYPPLGLMKISTFHKLRGDNVIYSREKIEKARDFFSVIYISTRFSFHWKKTSELIRFYQANYDAEILIGGIHSSIHPEMYEREFGIIPHVGSLRGEIEQILNKVKKDINLVNIYDDIATNGIDSLPPDYSLFDDVEYSFSTILKDNYLLRATKGCKRNCGFCSVKKIYRDYNEKLPIIPVVNYINDNFGKKRNILFYDDNTLMSDRIDEITTELVELGFGKGSLLNGKKRYCDFNQGLDLRLCNDDAFNMLRSISVKPIRFAFDDINIKDIFIRKIHQVTDLGESNISIYVLYNYLDCPNDFYERLKISIELNESLGCRIYSFPMKYIPTDGIDRTYIGKNWSKRMIRGVQCILNCLHGIVPVKKSFFEAAFGASDEEFKMIINMPEKYIIYRNQNNENIEKWKADYNALTEVEFEYAMQQISLGKNKADLTNWPTLAIQKFFQHYIKE